MDDEATVRQCGYVGRLLTKGRQAVDDKFTDNFIAIRIKNTRLDRVIVEVFLLTVPRFPHHNEIAIGEGHHMRSILACLLELIPLEFAKRQAIISCNRGVSSHH